MPVNIPEGGRRKKHSLSKTPETGFQDKMFVCLKQNSLSAPICRVCMLQITAGYFWIFFLPSLWESSKLETELEHFPLIIFHAWIIRPLIHRMLMSGAELASAFIWLLFKWSCGAPQCHYQRKLCGNTLLNYWWWTRQCLLSKTLEITCLHYFYLNKSVVCCSSSLQVKVWKLKEKKSLAHREAKMADEISTW